MFLALQIYDVGRESILRFASKNELAEERIAQVVLTLVTRVILVLPDFPRQARLFCSGKSSTPSMRKTGPHG